MSQSQSIAFVTGTSTGFGHLIARDLAAAGYRTFATMRDTATRNAEPKRTLEALGITVLELDVTSDASVDAAARIVNAAGPVDVLVNNAGAAFMGLSEAFTAEAAAKQFDVNVLSTLRVNRALLPAMRAAKRGLVVYISSVVGRVVIPFTGVYTASKWALEALAETASYELRPFGIDVAIVEPGSYGTNIFSAIVAPTDTARVQSYGDVAKIQDAIFGGLGESAGNPQEVADAVLALAKRAPGDRALRTVVGGSEQIDAINAASAPLQRELLANFGLEALLPREAAKVS
jgi:NAD(P)-dependent dehydrogenase (short-subunit alcohol dehydrogenase family)